MVLIFSKGVADPFCDEGERFMDNDKAFISAKKKAFSGQFVYTEKLHCYHLYEKLPWERLGEKNNSWRKTCFKTDHVFCLWSEND